VFLVFSLLVITADFPRVSQTFSFCLAEFRKGLAGFRQ